MIFFQKAKRKLPKSLQNIAQRKINHQTYAKDFLHVAKMAKFRTIWSHCCLDMVYFNRQEWESVWDHAEVFTYFNFIPTKSRVGHSLDIHVN